MARTKDFRGCGLRAGVAPDDGAADEVTYRRNTEAYERCDLVLNDPAGVESIDMSITVMGQKIDMPLFCAPTALLKSVFAGSIGKDVVTRTWCRVKGDWDAWNARSLAAEPIIRLILR